MVTETTLFSRLNEAIHGNLPNLTTARALLSQAQTALLKQQAEIDRLEAILDKVNHLVALHAPHPTMCLDLLSEYLGEVDG